MKLGIGGHLKASNCQSIKQYENISILTLLDVRHLLFQTKICIAVENHLHCLDLK